MVLNSLTMPCIAHKLVEATQLEAVKSVSHETGEGNNQMCFETLATHCPTPRLQPLPPGRHLSSTTQFKDPNDSTRSNMESFLSYPRAPKGWMRIPRTKYPGSIHWDFIPVKQISMTPIWPTLCLPVIGFRYTVSSNDVVTFPGTPFLNSILRISGLFGA